MLPTLPQVKVAEAMVVGTTPLEVVSTVTITLALLLAEV